MTPLIKFEFRFVKHFLILLKILIPLQIIGIVVLLAYLPFSKSRTLPYYLRWFDNADLYVERDTSVYSKVLAEGWWARYCWLAFRNPLNYFGYKRLGVSGTKFEQTVYTGIDSAKVGDGVGQHPGLFYTEVTIDDKIYFEYYYIKKYTVFGQVKCFRFRMGWKFGFISPIDKHIQWVMAIQPYHSYNGV